MTRRPTSEMVSPCPMSCPEVFAHVRDGVPLSQTQEGTPKKGLGQPDKTSIRRRARMAEHGTRSGWNRHRHLGETPCAPCRRALADYIAAYRARVRDRPRGPHFCPEYERIRPAPIVDTLHT